MSQIYDAHDAALQTCDILRDTIDIIDDITTTLEDGREDVRDAKNVMLQSMATGVIPMRTVGEITGGGGYVPISMQTNMTHIAQRMNVMRGHVMAAVTALNRDVMRDRLALGHQIAQEIKGVWAAIIDDMENPQEPIEYNTNESNASDSSNASNSSNTNSSNELSGGRLRKRAHRGKTHRGKTQRKRTHRGKTHRKRNIKRTHRNRK
jgi:hypothetical protein